jgi:hypothetical protein
MKLSSAYGTQAIRSTTTTAAVVAVARHALKSENVCPVWEEQQKWENRIRPVTHDANDRGRVKTPRPAARVEYLGVIARRESRIMLRPYGSIPCWRIVFSTFR